MPVEDPERGKADTSRSTGRPRISDSRDDHAVGDPDDPRAADRAAIAAIGARLSEVERNENVRVVIASDVGPRALGWGWDGAPRDIRFMYVREPLHYASKDPGSERIVTAAEGTPIVGTDARLALTHFRYGDAAVVEWFRSPVAVRATPEARAEFEAVLRQHVPPTHLLRHYVDRTALLADAAQGATSAPPLERLRDLLGACRSAVSARWVATLREAPPYPLGAIAQSMLRSDDARGIVARAIEASTRANAEEAARVIDGLIEVVAAEALTVAAMEVPDTPPVEREPLHALMRDWAPQT